MDYGSSRRGARFLVREGVYISGVGAGTIASALLSRRPLNSAIFGLKDLKYEFGVMSINQPSRYLITDT